MRNGGRHFIAVGDASWLAATTDRLAVEFVDAVERYLAAWAEADKYGRGEIIGGDPED